jgi:hypothetical protein
MTIGTNANKVAMSTPAAARGLFRSLIVPSCVR